MYNFHRALIFFIALTPFGCGYAKDIEEKQAVASARNGNIERLKRSISRGVPIDYQNEGNSLLYIATSSGQKGIVDYLVTQGANVDAPGLHGYTPLMVACLMKNKELVRAILPKVTDIDHKSTDGGYSALYLAADSNDSEITVMVLSKHPNVNLATDFGNTPLIAACKRAKGESVARILLKSGADPRIKDKQGMSAVDWAAKANNHCFE